MSICRKVLTISKRHGRLLTTDFQGHERGGGHADGTTVAGEFDSLDAGGVSLMASSTSSPQEGLSPSVAVAVATASGPKITRALAVVETTS